MRLFLYKNYCDVCSKQNYTSTFKEKSNDLYMVRVLSLKERLDNALKEAKSSGEKEKIFELLFQVGQKVTEVRRIEQFYKGVLSSRTFSFGDNQLYEPELQGENVEKGKALAKELEKRVRVPIPPQTADKGERQNWRDNGDK